MEQTEKHIYCSVLVTRIREYQMKVGGTDSTQRSSFLASVMADTGWDAF